MFKMSESLGIWSIFKGCLLLCAGVCLLLSLTPFTHLDPDGSIDSLMTGGLILNSTAFAVVVPMLLFEGLFTPQVPSPRQFSSAVVPPPVF